MKQWNVHLKIVRTKGVDKLCIADFTLLVYLILPSYCSKSIWSNCKYLNTLGKYLITNTNSFQTKNTITQILHLIAIKYKYKYNWTQVWRIHYTHTHTKSQIIEIMVTWRMCQDGCISTLCRQRWVHLAAKVKNMTHTDTHTYIHTT